MKPTYQNILRLKYIGNGRYNASWQGWPSDGGKRVTKRLTADNNEGAAHEAAPIVIWWGSRNSGHVKTLKK
jgi:hypothetical protein